MRTDQVMLCAAAVFGLVVAPVATRAQVPATSGNLQAAFEADVRAQARYQTFAEHAEREGRRGDAALFRAAAHAEGVRARMHSDVIRRFGEEPRPPSLESGRDVQDTRANLRWILARENAERAAVYPRYVDQARRDAIPEAVLAFTLAHHAEAGLVELYRDAVAGRLPTSSEFHVCETCGHVVRGDPPDRCPVSLSNRAAFTRIR